MESVLDSLAECMNETEQLKSILLILCNSVVESSDFAMTLSRHRLHEAVIACLDSSIPKIAVEAGYLLLSIYLQVEKVENMIHAQVLLKIFQIAMDYSNAIVFVKQVLEFV